MHIGYIITIIAAAIWLGFKIAEIIKAKKQSRAMNASTDESNTLIHSYDDMFVNSDESKE